MSKYAEIPQHIQDLIDARAEIQRLRGLLRKCQSVLNQVAETTLAADVMYEDIDKAIGHEALGDA